MVVAGGRSRLPSTAQPRVASSCEAAELRKERHDPLPVDFRQGVAEKLPFGHDQFDAVLSFQVIEHVRDIDQSLREMFRVLKPRGIVYMETGNSLYPREEHYRIFWPPLIPKPLGKLYAQARGKNPIHLDHVHFIYRRSILRRMRRAGFHPARDLNVDFVRDKCRNYQSISVPLAPQDSRGCIPYIPQCSPWLGDFSDRLISRTVLVGRETGRPSGKPSVLAVNTVDKSFAPR